MSQFCDYAGHDWECDGFALRPRAGDTEPSECYCLRHQVPMEVGDHSRCPVELLGCPDHRDEQIRAIRLLQRIDRHHVVSEPQGGQNGISEGSGKRAMSRSRKVLLSWRKPGA